MGDIVYNGFTEEQLRTAFDKMADPDDWKGPITATMPGECVMLAVSAIEFYTGATPQVSLNMDTMTYIVDSPGYRAGPAGDH